MKFAPIFREKIWGGNRIQTVLGMDFSPLANCGEAWVLSGVNGNQTTVANGFLEGNELNELVEVYMDDLVGEEVYERYGDEFPVLVKLIDANDYLSIQVHPGDELARKRHQSFGKSEMWYILDAVPGAELISGFSRQVDREQFQRILREKRLPEILHREQVVAGDVFYTPAGRVHAIGPGILLAEIQQTSDVTYRIFDWDRVDEKGNGRELHTDMAPDAIDFSVQTGCKTPYTVRENGTCQLVRSPHFDTNLIQTSVPLKKDYGELNSFVILLCLSGSLMLAWEGGSVPLNAGETILIPNMVSLVGLIPRGTVKLLEVHMH